jgi:hypothetical protein
VPSKGRIPPGEIGLAKVSQLLIDYRSEESYVNVAHAHPTKQRREPSFLQKKTGIISSLPTLAHGLIGL